MDQKERYIVRTVDGTGKTVVASTYQEVLAMYGEENVVSIEKLPYEEVNK